MLDICSSLGITKLNTTAYHSECDGMVERFNRTLKSMLRKHADKFGTQWERYLSGLLWAYGNTLHESTGEKPLFLLFGIDCRSPSESALSPPSQLEPTEVTDYREELALSLSTARKLAALQIQKAQAKYKKYHDKKAKVSTFKIGEWVLVKFPHEETGRMRKLSRPWHGPFRVISREDPDLTVTNVYFPGDAPIKIHQNRVSHCPKEFPAGYFWYGDKRKGTGKPLRWVEELLSGREEGDTSHPEPFDTDDTDTMPVEDTEINKSDIVEDVESEEEALGPSGSSIEKSRTRETNYYQRGSIKPPHRYL